MYRKAQKQQAASSPHCHKVSKAFGCCARGHVYRKALDLARRHFPAQVVPLEEEWGDWLMSQHQVDAAINHFIEAGCSMKAVEAALAARQWAKAAAILDSQVLLCLRTCM